jgi:hypothetical protein
VAVATAAEGADRHPAQLALLASAVLSLNRATTDTLTASEPLPARLCVAIRERADPQMSSGWPIRRTGQSHQRRAGLDYPGRHARGEAKEVSRRTVPV